MLTGFKSIYFIKCSKNGIQKNILIPYVDLPKVGSKIHSQISKSSTKQKYVKSLKNIPYVIS